MTAGDCLSSGRQNLWPNGDRHPGSLHTIIILGQTVGAVDLAVRAARPLRPIPVALSTPFVVQITCGEDDRAHHLGYFALHGLGDVGVAVQGNRHRRVAQPVMRRYVVDLLVLSGPLVSGLPEWVAKQSCAVWRAIPVQELLAPLVGSMSSC